MGVALEGEPMGANAVEEEELAAETTGRPGQAVGRPDSVAAATSFRRPVLTSYT